MTGAVVGVAVTNPLLALPLAFLSHFAQDAIPHHDDPKRFPLDSKQFTHVLILDAALCVVLVGLLFFHASDSWFIAGICAFLATSPDLMWMPRYLHAKRTGADPGTKGKVQKFHERVQWLTLPKGIYVEIVWAVGIAVLLAKLI